MQQTQEKSDTLRQNLDLSPLPQHSPQLNISRKIIDTSEFRILNSKIKKDSAKRTEDGVKQTRIIQKKQTIDPIRIIEPRITIAIPEIPVQNNVILPEKKVFRKNGDWVFGVIVLSLIIIASVRIIFKTYLKQLFNATINFPTATRLFRERTFNLLHAAFRLDILFYLILSLFAYQSFSSLGILPGGMKPFLIYLICLGIVIGYFLLKRFLYLIVSVLTESQIETSEFLFSINVYNRILGIVLFPITLIIAFVPVNNIKSLLIIGLIVIVISYGMTLARGSKILLRKHFSISYLILYLCTLEFLPLFVIYKIISE